MQTRKLINRNVGFPSAVTNNHGVKHAYYRVCVQPVETDLTLCRTHTNITDQLRFLPVGNLWVAPVCLLVGWFIRSYVRLFLCLFVYLFIYAGQLTINTVIEVIMYVYMYVCMY